MNELDNISEKRQCEYSFGKTFRFDWDIWLVKLFRKKKTTDVESPDSIDDVKDKGE